MKIIGIAGGGQLGRMLTDAAHTLRYSVIVLDPTPNSPAGLVADEQIVGDYKDKAHMEMLAQKVDVVTFEVESVNAEALIEIAAAGKPVHPLAQTLKIIKDKLFQKSHFSKLSIPVADFAEVSSIHMAADAGALLGYPFILKTRRGGFDGRGNALIDTVQDIPDAVQRLGTDLYAEKLVLFQKELAVVAARTVSGEIVIYPLIETIHRDHICHMTLVPANVPDTVLKKAHDVAKQALTSFEGAGVFGIEMFLVGEDIIINEIAPRVHNSGHWTIEGAETSQFEQHIRAITGMPLGSVALKAPAAVMINILGERNALADPQGVTEAEKIEGVKVHMYGKIETRMKRKMGHITALAETLPMARSNVEKARSLITI